MRRLVLILALLMPTVNALSAQTNFPKTLDSPISSSPVLVDFDSDGFLEMIITTENGSIHILESNGNEAAGWPKNYSFIGGMGGISRGIFPKSPAVGNLDGTGDPEIVVIFSNSGGSSVGNLTAWWSNGTSYWTKTTSDEITSAPALADIDGDGKLDIIFGSWNNNIYATYYNGTTAWTYPTGGRVYASSAVADLNGDGNSDILIPSSDGKLYVLFGNGTSYWNYSIGTTYYTAPVVGDLDFDGDLEIIIGSSTALYAFSDTGAVLSGWPRNDIKWTSPPALGDLEGDGNLEIVVGTQDLSGNGLYVLFKNGTTKWSKALGDERIISSPSIADIDGDGAYDIVVATAGGTLYVYSGNGVELSSESLGTSNPYSRGSSPAIADFDGDGDLEILIGSYDSKVYGFDTPSTNIFVPWAMYQRDVKNSGFYNSPSIKITSPADGSVFNVGDTITFNGTASDSDGYIVSYTWKVNFTVINSSASFDYSETIPIGTYIINFTAIDNDNGQAEARVTIRINAPPTISIINPLNSTTYKNGTTVDFKAVASDQDGTIANYTWYFGDGDIFTNSSNPNTTHNYSTTGTYTVILNVTDNDNANTTAETTITITPPEAPNATILSPADGSIFNTGEEIAFKGTGTPDVGRSIMSHAWDFDGDDTYDWTSNITGNTTYSYTYPGVYTPLFKVTDNNNNLSVVGVSITLKTSGVVSVGDGGAGGGGGAGSPSPVKLLSTGAIEMSSTTYSNILITLSAGGKIDKDRFVETSTLLAGPLLLTKKYPLPTDPTVAKFARTVERITGDVYLAVAGEAMQYAGFRFSPHEGEIVIARGDLGVDSMAALAYAKAKNVPILLVKPEELPTITESAIDFFLRVGKRDITIIGGPVAVSKDVEQKLGKKSTVKRIYGDTRIETAVALAEEAYPDKNKIRVIVITDYENPKIDVALMSYLLDAPLLYVKSDGLSPIVKEYILNHKETIFGPTKIVLMGVDPKVASEINEALNS